MRFSILLKTSTLLFSLQALAASPFVEESTRKTWDRGCQDWPAEISKVPGVADTNFVKSNPEIFAEKTGGYLRVYADMRVNAEKGESESDLMRSVLELLTNGDQYSKWVMPGINEKADGGSYFVNVDDLNSRLVEPNRLFWLTGGYSFSLLWFKRTGISTMEVFQEEVPAPNCELFANYPQIKDAKIKKLTYRMVPRPEIIKMMMTEVYVLPTKDRVDLRLRLVAEPSMIVYQLMPEGMMKNQLHDRGKRIFSNFLELRKTVSADLKKAPPPKSAAVPSDSAPKKSTKKKKKL